MKKAKTFKSNIGGVGKKFVKKRLYETVNWIEYRNKFLIENPKCYACSKRSVVVDHIVAAKGKEELFWNETNYLPLCKECHDIITGKFDRHAVPMTEEKMKWIEGKRTETGTTVRVRVVPLKD